MQIQKSSRPLVILLATVVVIITSMVVANATQTITTPNAVNIPFNLARSTNSAPITPATNRPVLVMGCVTTSTDQGVGQVTLLHIPSTGMAWVGLNANSTTTESLITNVPQNIVGIDPGLFTTIQVNSADTIRVRNAQSITVAGNVTLIW